MRSGSAPRWTLAGIAASFGAVASAAGVLDIGLAFPRANEPYEASDSFPFVFALQNSKQSEHLNPSIWYRIINITNFPPDVEVLADGNFDFNWTRASANDPYFLWGNFKAQGEGKLRIMWQPAWSYCDERGTEPEMARNRTDNFLVDFEIKQGGTKPDRMTGTGGDSNNCPNEGVTVQVSDRTHEVHAAYQLGAGEKATCAVLAASSPTATSNPCKVKIDAAAVESMDAVDLERRCRGLDPPAECPESEDVVESGGDNGDEEDGAVSNLAAVGVSAIAALLGAAFLVA
ncbi:hypothetical protein F5X68DRAFT_236059 [Plectosphaerella plurivora]|uniref:DUF7136 domain-containing protein n=1 Tax=Plectosphaerella plurivora TaxID=936078 RepID=A0A9P9A821_9PEZI|nr:hypothetical protein F5X68DRAFT_236059 [Plectosphaerella plurivora]